MRAATRDDWPYMINSWMRSNWRNTKIHNRHVSHDAYKDNHPPLITAALRRCNARVAIPEVDDTNSEIAGWMVSDDRADRIVVHYCYTTKLYRRMGVARMLLRDAGWEPGKSLVATHVTHVNTEWRNIINTYKPQVNPYFFYKES